MRFVTSLSSSNFALNVATDRPDPAEAMTKLFPGMTERIASEALRLHRIGALDRPEQNSIEIPDRLCGPPADAVKPAEGETCKECVMGSPIYIPCGKPAEFIIENRGEVVPMCQMDADHNVRNRGASYQRAAQ